MLGSAQLALRPVGRVVPGGAVAVSGMPQRLGAAEQSAPAAAVRRPPRPAAAAAVPAALRRSCGDKATPICTPSWPSAPTRRKRLARKHIEAGEVGLHLPLAANVEFDQLSLVQSNALPSSVFDAHEPVIGSHPLLPGAGAAIRQRRGMEPQRRHPPTGEPARHARGRWCSPTSWRSRRGICWRAS